MPTWRTALPFRALGNLQRRLSAARSRSHKLLANKALRIEPFEARRMMAISPSLIAVIPNVGDIIQENDSLHIAPRQLTLRFDDGQLIAPGTLGAIQLTRSGGDDVFNNGNDLTVTTGFVGLADNQNEVIVRFDRTLPDDRYQLKIGAGLTNTEGDPFNNGVDQLITFQLNLGAQVVSVVPQPVTRLADGSLSQAVNQIDVYFNDDDLEPASATNRQLYELIRTNDSATNVGDTIVNPIAVTYDPLADKAVLTFAAGVLTTPGSYRLRIGNNDPIPAPPSLRNRVATDPGSSFATAMDEGNIGVLSQGLQSTVITAEITPTDAAFPQYTLEWPGSDYEPGHRQINPLIEDHGAFIGDTVAGVPTVSYGFPPVVGGFANLITENQKTLARQIMGFYSEYLGVQFVESVTPALPIMTADLGVVLAVSEPGGVAGIFDPLSGIVVMDSAEVWDDRGPESSTRGVSWFQVAMHEIGHALGLGHSYDLAPITIQGSNEIIGADPVPLLPPEQVFPGDHDVVHGRFLFRPDVRDIDLYRFNVVREGRVTLETIAERLAVTSQLDTLLTVYDANRNVIARNDDYFSEDSFLSLDLAPGVYFVAVTATGNSQFDPAIENTGMGGRSQGDYELRVNFVPKDESTSRNLIDKDVRRNPSLVADPSVLDGDADGQAGGAYNFWFRVQDAAHTIFVDKASAVDENLSDGSLARPYKRISLALAKAAQDPTSPDVVRIVGNGGADGDLATLGDNLAYHVGVNVLDQPLSDGASMEVPAGVTVMIDAGAIFKLRQANIDVGSSAVGISRAEGALQVLGTTARDSQGRDVGSVYFTSYHNELLGRDDEPARSTRPVKGDWGGLVFRQDSDRETDGLFLNYVNHANLTYGGGTLIVDATPQVFNPIHLVTARPTISFNTITNSADAAISADPDSFEDTEFQDSTFTADYGRVGPDVHGNELVRNDVFSRVLPTPPPANPPQVERNSIDGLFIRVLTPAGDNLQPLTVPARMNDTDIVHYLPETLLIQGTPGGPLDNQARLDARLRIDPGITMKLDGARIETQLSSQLIAEGTEENPIIFTSKFDDRFGGSGSFDTTADGAVGSASPGDWAGLYFGHLSSGSVDHALVTFAGGNATIEGTTDNFNPIEIHQATVRVAHTTIEHNSNGLAATDRVGRGGNDEAAIFVRGAQPLLLNNKIQHNTDGPMAAVSINVNALNSEMVADWGRSTGLADFQGDYLRNRGPVVDGNRLTDNAINGMVVRGGVLTTQGVWDDTDITHVVQSEIMAVDHHTFSGLRLVSNDKASLVVKFDGPSAGLTANGEPLDVEDRIGGTVIVLGNVRHPVILTSFADDTEGAGLDPNGQVQRDTNNNGPSSGTAGDWRSIRIDSLSNDRNAETYYESEGFFTAQGDVNNVPNRAEFLGQLAGGEKSGDDVLRLGFEVTGTLTAQSDVDVYSFKAKAGTEVWLDLDRTSSALDAVVELINANGAVIVRSDNSPEELAAAQAAGTLFAGRSPDLFGTEAYLMERDFFSGTPGFFANRDFYTTNPLDAGVRIVLPGAAGTTGTYYVRVRSSSANLNDDTAGLTRGNYQLQVRLREIDEIPGSTVRYADIRFATNGIEVFGKPGHSPLLGETAESTANNDTRANAQNLGNLATTDRGTISVAGTLDATRFDVDWYRLEIAVDQIQVPTSRDIWPTIFDIDYAEAAGRPNAILWVFDDQGRLVYFSHNSDVDEDQLGPDVATDATDLGRASFGPGDPLLGPIDLREGRPNNQPVTYFLAVTSDSQFANELQNNPLVRLEPVDSVDRIAEDHINSSFSSTANPARRLFEGDGTELNTYADEFHLGDVVLFATNGQDLYTIDPYTGLVETDVTGVNVFLADTPSASGGTTLYNDISMRDDGRLFALTQDVGPFGPAIDRRPRNGSYRELDAGNGAVLSRVDDEINSAQQDPADPANYVDYNAGVSFEAFTHRHVQGEARTQIAVGTIVGRPNGITQTTNLIYHLTVDGVGIDDPFEPADAPPDPSDVEPVAQILTAPTLILIPATDVSDGVGDPRYLDPGDLLDGMTVLIVPQGGAPQTFEFDTGPDLQVDLRGAAAFRDGQSFRVARGAQTNTFEFNSGPVLVTQGLPADGTVFSITGTVARRFEIDVNVNNPPVDPTATKINLSNLAPGETVEQRIAQVITAANIGVTASVSTQFPDRVTLRGDRASALITPPGAGLELQGNYGVTAGNLTIDFEEVDAADVFLTAIVTAVNGAYPNMATFADRNFTPQTPADAPGDRLTFFGATIGAGDLVNAPGLSLRNGVGGGPSAAGVTNPGAIAVRLNANDQPDDIAVSFANAVNGTPGLTYTATAVGGQVQLIVNDPTMPITVTPTPPIQFSGPAGGQGGRITGIARAALLDLPPNADQDTDNVHRPEDILYAVTDAGDILLIDSLSFAPPSASYMPDPVTPKVLGHIDGAGGGVQFAGLSFGAPNVENARFRNVLFATALDGRMYAFQVDPDNDVVAAAPVATPAPIFNGGATSVPLTFTGGGAAPNMRGITFSTLDYNLWHVSNRRGPDPGHGIYPTDDLSRLVSRNPAVAPKSVDGGTSFYFGFEDPRQNVTISTQRGASNFAGTNDAAFQTYNLPGGAHGSLTTDTFSLAGYAETDLPAVYYNYFYAAEADGNRDAVRVFISNNGADWTQLPNVASWLQDDPFILPGDPALLQATPTRNTGGWRQARASLAGFAGLENLRLRFDFSTAGSMNVGDALGATGSRLSTGTILRSRPGAELRDGEQFTIDGVVFEFDSGYTLVVPAAADSTIVDGETFTVTGAGGTATFEFDRGDGLNDPNNLAVDLAAADSPASLAAKIGAAIAAANLGVTPIVVGERVNLPGATDLTQGPGAVIVVEGAPGVAAGNEPVVIDSGMDADTVALVIGRAADNALIAGQGNLDDPNFIDSVKVDGSLIHVIGHVVEDPGPLPFSAALPGDNPDPNDPDRFFIQYRTNRRGQDNAHEGFYLDDIIIGFTERGEMVTFAQPNDSFTRQNPIVALTHSGAYDLEIRRASDYGMFVLADLDDSRPHTHNLIAFDTNARLNRNQTIVAAAGAEISDGESFTISDGLHLATFEFDSDGITVTGKVPIPFLETSTAETVAGGIPAEGIFGIDDIINQFSQANPLFKVKATTIEAVVPADPANLTGFRLASVRGTVELIGAAWVNLDAAPSLGQFSSLDVAGLYYEAVGDRNLFRDQGATLIQANKISDALQWGIRIDASPRTVNDNYPHSGTVRNLREINTQRLVPGIAVQNNLLVGNAVGGILFSGDNVANGPPASVPFGRILNNTVYGGASPTGVGIDVGQNASPTVMNNVFANLQTGVQVDASSATSVVLANVYQGNAANLTGAADSRQTVLGATDPLFVNAAVRNFYPVQGSRAIDSSLNTLQERPAMQTVTSPLGIAVSPILAPDFDLFGVQRIDDPSVAPPPGQGSNVFKDRGAIDRADFLGPSAALLVPADNDSAGLDSDPRESFVRFSGQTVPYFAVQLSDGAGIGIADDTVTPARFTLTKDGVTLALTADYLFRYDPTDNVVRFEAAAGVFLEGEYVITVDRTAITDLAANALRSNQADDTLRFTIVLGPPLRPWQNPNNPLDVNDDGFVVGLDALIVINRLNRDGAGPLPLPAVTPPYYDVNGDGRSTPLDALIIINFLNSGTSQAAQAQGAALVAEPLAAAEDPAPLALVEERKAVDPPPALPAAPAKSPPAAAVAVVLADDLLALADEAAAEEALEALGDYEGLADDPLRIDWHDLLS